MKVLLTGATGFIGSHVARALTGHEVVTLDRPQHDLLAPDFRPPSSVFDVCIHLAWYVEPGKYLESPLNEQWVDASLHLARTIRCRRFVGAGTCFEYLPSNAPLHEFSPTGPRTFYAQSKLKLFEALQRLDLEVAWLRFFYQYGPGEDARRLMPHVINSLLRNEPCKLTPGEQVRDFLHVEDVAGAVCAVAKSQLTGAVNIGSGQPVTVREIAQSIGEIIGKSELVQLGARPYAPGDPMYIVADNTKLRSTGWLPKFSLADGLQQTIEWWRQIRPPAPTR